jgi:hypothetical protein
MTIYLAAFMLLYSCKPSHKQLNTSKSHESKPFNNLYIEKEMILAVSWKFLDYSNNVPRYGLRDYQYTYKTIRHSAGEIENDYLGTHILDFAEILINNNFNSIKNRWIIKRPLSDDEYQCDNSYKYFYFLETILDNKNKSEKELARITFPSNVSNLYTLPVSKFMHQIKSSITDRNMFFNDIYLFKCKVTYQKTDSIYNTISLPELNLKRKDMKSKDGVEIVMKKSNKIIHRFDGGAIFKKSGNIIANIPIKSIWENHLKNKSIYYPDISSSINDILRNYEKIEYAMIESLHKASNLTNNYIYAINSLTPFPVDSIGKWLQNNPDIRRKMTSKSIKEMKKNGVTFK